MNSEVNAVDHELLLSMGMNLHHHCRIGGLTSESTYLLRDMLWAVNPHWGYVSTLLLLEGLAF